MQIVINRDIWNKIEDVPQLTLEWARLIGGNEITLEDVKDLVIGYEDWLDKTIK